MAYTPPDIRYIHFIVGDDAITSPYVDIYEPMLVMDSEVVTTNIINVQMPGFLDGSSAFVADDGIGFVFDDGTAIVGDGLPGLLDIADSEVSTMIISWTDMVEPKTVSNSEVFTYKLLYVDLIEPLLKMASEVVTTTIISCEMKEPWAKMDIYMGSDTVMVEPKIVMESVVITPNMIANDMIEPKATLSSVVNVWHLIVVDMVEPLSKADCTFTVPATYQVISNRREGTCPIQ